MREFNIEGRLTETPKIDDKKALISLAVNENYQNKETGEDKNIVNFFNMTCFNKFYFNGLEQAQKGDILLAKGQIQNNSYEKDGVKVNTFDFVARDIKFIKTIKKAEE